MSEERRTDKMLDKLMRLWPVASIIVAGATWFVKLQIQVANVAKVPEQVSVLKDRVIVLETQMAVIQARRRGRTER